MAQQQSQPDAATETGEAAPADAEVEDTSAAGTEPAETGAPAGDAAADKPEVEGDKPPETEEEKAEKAKAESEWEIKVKAAAEKYAKDQIAQANRTMAAARRAEKAQQAALAQTQTEIATLKQENGVLAGFVDQMHKAPLTALGRLGFKSVKDFIDHCVSAGGEGKPQTDDERIAALLDKKLEEREAPRKQAAQEAAIEESKKAVFAYVDGEKERFDLVTTDIGHDRLWKAIESYHRKHGVVPDEAVPLIADEVEKELGSSLSKTKRFGQSQPAKNGTPASGAAAAGASSSGKTLAGKPTSGAPSAKKYSADPDERREQINAELRAEGLL